MWHALKLTPHGASGENRTLISSLEDWGNDHYTTLAFDAWEGLAPPTQRFQSLALLSELPRHIDILRIF